MQIANEFTIEAGIEELWAHLEVEQIAPCMPGAELTETVDDHNWKGKLHTKFGPVSLVFVGSITMEERDEAAHRVVLRASGMEEKGKGAVRASVVSWLEAGASDQTTVKLTADIQLTGAAAQLSRGLLPEVSRRLTQEFAERLRASMEMANGDTSAPVGMPPSLLPVKPISGIRLGLSVLAGLFRNIFRLRLAHRQVE